MYNEAAVYHEQLTFTVPLRAASDKIISEKVESLKGLVHSYLGDSLKMEGISFVFRGCDLLEKYINDNPNGMYTTNTKIKWIPHKDHIKAGYAFQEGACVVYRTKKFGWNGNRLFVTTSGLKDGKGMVICPFEALTSAASLDTPSETRPPVPESDDLFSGKDGEELPAPVALVDKQKELKNHKKALFADSDSEGEEVSQGEGRESKRRSQFIDFDMEFSRIAQGDDGPRDLFANQKPSKIKPRDVLAEEGGEEP
eukprot:NODE_4028_length_875_cov_19.894673_g3714_i0.p1 GENE.NODE_4028_length_875_cov_19.894673_g3714_i0~~NODE_4028_length_875_cov_19.894673_g3714_i0.p1  ORF type:complete len:268 (-),score=48.78 NODE_4028_length_875_cov_19.894673_g3714_i0:70-831(-)